jgi:hypothetical protein
VIQKKINLKLFKMYLLVLMKQRVLLQKQKAKQQRRRLPQKMLGMP